MRLVLDTNIVVSAFLWDGMPSRLLARIIEDAVSLTVSNEMMLELDDVLSRKKLQPRFAASKWTAETVLATYAAMATSVLPGPRMPIAPDPDDDWVIATAVAAQADLIVTGDKPFLNVGAVGSVRIVTVAEALAEVALA